MTENQRLDPVRLIWPLRAANAVGRGLARLGIEPSLEPDRLEALARRETGLDDFGEGTDRAPLERLCTELDGPANLTTAGRLAARDHIVRGLANRLLLVESRRRDPAVGVHPLVPPLVVIGLPRSGTTFLHRVLCHAPDALSLPTWALQRPVPPFDGPDRRHAIGTETVERIRRMAPGLDAKHHIDADGPEECMLLLDASLASLTYGFLFPAYDYTEWLYTRDGIDDYACWRESLTLFQRQAPGKRLTLKAPTHTGFLDAIWHHAPNALVVHPHRDPAVTVGSLCSLFYTLHGLAVDRVDRARLGQCMLTVCERLATRCIADREKHPEKAVVDVAYRRLVADPVQAVAEVYAGHGLRFDAFVEAAVTDGVAHHPQHRFGRHDYALEDFGLTAEGVRARLAAYLDRFGHLIEL